MPEWVPVAIILLSGGVGGIINALLGDNGFKGLHAESMDNVHIVRPGFLGNILLGATAAFISWGLYDMSSGAVIYGAPAELGGDGISISISTIAGAILMGVGGARWLNNETDKAL